MANPRPTTSEWTLLAGASVTVVASFLDAVAGVGAWGRGLSTLKLVPIYAIAVGGVVAMRRFARAELPEHIGRFTWAHVFVVLSFFATVIAVAWIFTAGDPEVGLYAMTLGGLVMLAGAAMELRTTTRRLHLVPAAPRAGSRVESGDIVVLGAGALMVLGSFFTFFEVGALGLRFNAWSSDFFFPVTAVPVACGVVAALTVLVQSVMNIDLPARIAGFTWDQVLLASSAQAAVTMFVFMVEDNGAFDFGVGFYCMLIAAAALIVGAVMRTREPRTSY